MGLSETENTYRMRVTLTLGEVTSPAYDIVMIKREDKTVYFNSVHEAVSYTHLEASAGDLVELLHELHLYLGGEVVAVHELFSLLRNCLLYTSRCV